jgi:hypothetical protein
MKYLDGRIITEFIHDNQLYILMAVLLGALLWYIYQNHANFMANDTQK